MLRLDCPYQVRDIVIFACGVLTLAICMHLIKLIPLLGNVLRLEYCGHDVNLESE
jgi:hypothetical protein